MPNHVTTIINAPSHVLSALVGTDENNEQVIDFEKILPIPKFVERATGVIDSDVLEKFKAFMPKNYPSIYFHVGLNIFETSYVMEFRHRNGKKLGQKYLEDVLQKFVAENTDIAPSVLEGFVASMISKALTGCLDGYEWRIQYWGTKWNAYECVIDTDNEEVTFDTAWNFPAPVLVALSVKFPNEIIKARYADEDIGVNCGELTLKDGKVIAMSRQYDDTEHTEDYWNNFATQVKYGLTYEEYCAESL